MPSHSYQIIDTDTGDLVYEILPEEGDPLLVLVDPADWGWDCHGGSGVVHLVGVHVPGRIA
ncbi:MAG: hypothetical protein R2844_23260 [Caldilineales bacterium]